MADARNLQQRDFVVVKVARGGTVSLVCNDGEVGRMDDSEDRQPDVLRSNWRLISFTNGLS